MPSTLTVIASALLAATCSAMGLSSCAGRPEAPTSAAPSHGASAPSASPPPSTVTAAAPRRIDVTFGPALSRSPVDGRLLVILSRDSAEAPRFGVSNLDGTAQIFGIDVDGLAPGATASIDGRTFGYPLSSLEEIPEGDYVVEAVLHRYETFVRGDGHTVKLPPDRGEGQQWALAPGNFLSTPKKIHIGNEGPVLPIELDKVIEPLAPTADTKYVRHVRYQSERLTKFWGRPTFLGAIVLVPEGFDAHPDVRYPLAIAHGHFSREFFGFREEPVDTKLPPPNLEALRTACPNGHEGEACTKNGYERLSQELQHKFFDEWRGPGFPRVIAVQIQHANPYYDDSYAVNSENVGPYGDAITYELLPYLEKTFRGIGPAARGVYGGSTGGWEALAAQVFYPDDYNGAIANCPDPIDFRAYMNFDLYAEKNAYFTAGPFRRTARPAERDYLGQVRSTIEQENHLELVLGTKSRSGGQWDIWEAVFSPVASDGYPARIWDKRTGVIDPRVAAYWRDHFDLGYALRRDWARLAPKLRGKITINVGLSDNFFLNDAVYLVEDFFKTATPKADAVVTYGARDEHCWSGDATTFNGISRFTGNARAIRALAERWRRATPRPKWLY